MAVCYYYSSGYSIGRYDIMASHYRLVTVLLLSWPKLPPVERDYSRLTWLKAFCQHCAHERRERYLGHHGP